MTLSDYVMKIGNRYELFHKISVIPKNFSVLPRIECLDSKVEFRWSYP